MKITELAVSGFGVWRDVKLTGLSDGLNVFFGANESGKTTLMQFVRAMFYGFSPARRRRYFPPVHGGLPGGTLRVINGQAWVIERLDFDADEAPLGKLALVDEQSAPAEDGRLRELLGGVDETTYVNIFAVGLHELEELRTLSDTDAADLLYKLSTGLDRVSLVEVMRELGVSRNRLLSADGRISQITQLEGQRARLSAEIDELRAGADRYAELSADQHDFDASVERLQADVHHFERETRVLEAAVGLREKWADRRRLARQLAELGEIPNFRPHVLEDLDQVNARIARRKGRLRQLKLRRRRARRLAKGFEINETLERQAPRIAAAAEQLAWIGALEKQVAELRDEVAQLEQQAAAVKSTPPPPPPKPVVVPKYKTPAGEAISQLKPLGVALRKAKEQLQQAHEQHRVAEAQAQTLAAAPKPAPVMARPSTSDIEKAGALVATLRKRIQVEEKLEKLAMQESEIADLGRQHLEHRVLSGNMMLALALPFVGGTTMTFAGLFLGDSLLPTNWSPWSVALLGGICVFGSVAAKSLMERGAALRYEEAREQLEQAESQAARLRTERDRLDAELPIGGGPLAVRLRAAQDQLAKLQGSATSKEEHAAVREDALVSRELLDEAIEAYRRARKRWREHVAQLGLPANIQLRALREQAELEAQAEATAAVNVEAPVVPDATRPLELKRAELQQRRRELDAIHERLRQLVAETGLELPGERPADQIVRLRAELSRQDDLRGRRDRLIARRRRLGSRFAKERRRLRRSLRARRRLLRSAGVPREDELRQLVATHSRGAALRRDAEQLERDVLAVIGGVCTLAEVGEFLDAEPGIDLDAQWDATTAKLQAAERQLRDLYERRGRRGEQISALLADRRLPAKVFELGLIEEQLRQAIDRWRVVSLAGQTLEQVRRSFERDHQPIVLREASRHLERLTRGRYTRIWAPLDRPILRIDSAEGETIDVEQLSRGTREQIYLALRLALVAAYARRGVRLPMVLDDVLVNFDQDRAAAAAELLRDFAAAGHQILLFTCHEHIFKLFKSLKAAAQVLPSHVAAVVEVPDVETPAPRRAPRPRAPRKPKVVAAPPPAPRPLPTLTIIERPEPAPPPPPSTVVIDYTPLLEVTEAVIMPAPPLEELSATVLSVDEEIPAPLEISLPPSPSPPSPSERPRRMRTFVQKSHRFTWEDPVDLKPSEGYFRDDDGEEA